MSPDVSPESDLTPEMRRRGTRGVEGVDFPRIERHNDVTRDGIDPNTKGEDDEHERRTRGRTGESRDADS